MKIGVDVLGAAQYEDAVVRGLIPGVTIGIFYNNFVKRGTKNNRGTIIKLAETGKPVEILTQVAPFDYSHKYQISKYLPQVKKDFIELNKIARDYPHIDFLGSPFCEHTHSRAVMTPVFNELKDLAPDILMTNSILSTGQEVPGTITDIHLENSRPKARPKNPEYTVSADGFGGKGTGDFPDADVSTIIGRYKDARSFRGWNFFFNGKWGHLDETPINERTAWAIAKDVRGILKMLKPREGIVSWEKDKLLKAFSDDHKGDDRKDKKMMCILPWSAEEAIVLDSKNNIVDRMYRFRPDHTSEPKGARYYSNKYAYEVADRAVKNTGSALIKIKVGRNTTKLTDGYLRSGRFK